MKKTTAMMALLLIICAAVFFYGCTNKSSYSNSDDAYINYATDMQLMCTPNGFPVAGEFSEPSPK